MTVTTLYPDLESESTPRRAFTLSLFDVPSVPRVKMCARCPQPIQGSHPYCRACQREYSRQRYQLPHVKAASARHGRNYRKANAAHVSRYMRIYHLVKTYGLTVDDYEAMKAAQGNACAICKETETKIFKGGRLMEMAIDHDHETGKVRGLLCGRCNSGLGNFRDNTELMQTAMAYLDHHRSI